MHVSSPHPLQERDIVAENGGGQWWRSMTSFHLIIKKINFDEGKVFEKMQKW